MGQKAKSHLGSLGAFGGCKVKHWGAPRGLGIHSNPKVTLSFTQKPMKASLGPK